MSRRFRVNTPGPSFTIGARTLEAAAAAMVHRFPIEERHAKTREHRVKYVTTNGVRYAYVHVVTRRTGRVVTGCVIYDDAARETTPS